MESVYLMEILCRMEKELNEHRSGKYKQNTEHDDCKPRIMATMKRLRERLQEEEISEIKKQSQAESAGCRQSEATVRGEKMEKLRELGIIADELERCGLTKEAADLRLHVYEQVAAQLNEFDGFSLARH